MYLLPCKEVLLEVKFVKKKYVSTYLYKLWDEKLLILILKLMTAKMYCL